MGYFVLMLAVDEAHLLNISIAEKRQGLGLGARLLRYAMEMARHGGATTLLLEVRPSNSPWPSIAISVLPRLVCGAVITPR